MHADDIDNGGSEEDMDMSDADEVQPTNAAAAGDESGPEGSDAEEEIEVSDMDASADGEDEQQAGLDQDMQDEDAEDAEDAEENEDPEEQEISRSPSIQPSPRRRGAGRPNTLKITLKLPSMSSIASISAVATPTPSDKPHSTRRARDIESEDDDDDDDSSRSASVAGPSRLTQRQAALAGVVDTPEHVSLEEPESKKKKHLNAAELALRREETARKRRNLSVKKLEDEKAETINRLLKKQSRGRGKRSALATADPDEDEGDAEEENSSQPTPNLPTLYRWISSTKSGVQTASLSIPVSALNEDGKDRLAQIADNAQNLPPTPKPTPICDVSGCALPRKYKLVQDPTRGGCGMEHLKALQVS